MRSILQAAWRLVKSFFSEWANLAFENIALRHQLAVLQRSVERPKIHRRDRILWSWLLRLWPRWQSALLIIKPETVISWHRQGFKLYWRWKSRATQGRPCVDREIRDLIRLMSRENPTWGAPRIQSELRLLGHDVADSTVAKYMIDEVTIDPQSPWQNPYVERIIGSIRRECLDHVIVLNEDHLRRILADYFAYHHEARTHLSLERNSPIPRSICTVEQGKVVSKAYLGGLHHCYTRAA